MAGLATTTHGADEAALAQRAAAGDGDAFATLYERYESRVLNLCFRILGSQDDAADAAQEAFVNVLRRLPKLEGRELAFGSYVFTSARNACYDLIERRRRTEPSDDIPEHATPVGGGVGGGGMGFDPGDPEDHPERNVLLEARTGEIREANLTLPERQREVLALKELEGLSYDEIAEIMGMNRNSVAQLISRARIGLRDALRGTALASIAPSSPDCERAAPLLSALGDGQLRGDSPEAEWLGDHLVTCDSCPLRATRCRRPACPIARGCRSAPGRSCSARRWPRPPSSSAPTGARCSPAGRAPARPRGRAQPRAWAAPAPMAPARPCFATDASISP